MATLLHYKIQSSLKTVPHDGEVISFGVSSLLLERVEVQGLLGSYGHRPLPLITLSSCRANCLSWGRHTHTHTQM